MSLTISGTILEKESRLPVAGLMVRAYHKRHLYDDRLPMAMTRADGRFLLECREADTPQLFQAREEIHISIYALPCQFLMDAERTIPTGTSKLKYKNLVLEIPRSILGDLSPSRSAGKVEGGVNFTMEQVTLEKFRAYDIPRIPGFDSGGAPGAPTLLSQIHTIALPYEAKNLQLKVIPGQPVSLPGPVNPYPVQPHIMINNVAPGKSVRCSSNNLPPAAFRALDVRLFEKGKAYPGELAVLGPVSEYLGIKFVTIKVSPVQYNHAGRVFVCYPHLRYTCTYEIAATVSSPTSRSYKWGDFNQIRAIQLNSFLNQPNVYKASELYDTPPAQLIISSKRNVPYVIITDDYFWDWTEIPTGTGTRAPNTQEGQGSGLHLTKDSNSPVFNVDPNVKGATFHFERLAQWKTSRGMRTQVVTISDIVNKKWGDFTEKDFARDLQEVIHNFIKYIHDAWGTDYVLLAGSRQIIPMRALTGYATGQGNFPGWDFFRNYPKPDFGEIVDQPPPGGVYVDKGKGQALLCQDTSFPLDNLWNIPDSAWQLCTTDGDIIPFKTTKPGDKTLGWYFAEQDYSPHLDASGNLATDPFLYSEPGILTSSDPLQVCNIIVEGPPLSIDRDYYWVPPPWSQRLIPSDLYYSDTLSHPALHDFDWNGNGLYGQFHWDAGSKSEISVDIENLTTGPDNDKAGCGRLPVPQVSVGRAPIANIEDAKAFVDKVLTYERLEAPDGTTVDRDYLRRVVYGADIWDESYTFSQFPDSANAFPDLLAEGNFNFQPGKLVIRLQENLFTDLNNGWGQGQDQVWSHPHIVLRFYSDDFETSTDFDIGSRPGLMALSRCIDWTFVDDKLNPIDSPTHFVLIYGENLIIRPNRIIWFPNRRLDQRAENEATQLKEAVRSTIEACFPNFTQARIYYADYFGLLPNGILPERLSVNSIRSALDSGCHFVSLAGHGGTEGCCSVWWAEFDYHQYGPFSKEKWIFPDFNNDKRYFIAYANSCYTAIPDDLSHISLGERLVTDPQGGAVAYIGCVREGFDDISLHEVSFWRLLKVFGRIGPAAGTPPQVAGDSLWARYELMLYGDPEMPVWTDIPGDYQVLSPVEAIPGEVIKIAVFFEGHGMPWQQVTFMAGWSGSEYDPPILKTIETDDHGMVQFNIPSDMVPGYLLTVTITPALGIGHSNFKPYVMSILIKP